LRRELNVLVSYTYDAFTSELKAVDEVQACYIPIWEAGRVKTKELKQ
jgi:hypothetical protein